jgi:hypothetical protein
MKVSRLLAGASALGLVAAAPAPQQKVTGPVANYWTSVGTSSGSGFGAMGQGASGAKPSMGDIMKMMRGGTSVNHELTLQLGSTRAATGEPKADHLPGTGQPLPLLTPKIVPPKPVPEESVEEQPTMPQRPKGKILIYWGCGEHAGPSQPVVIDFAKILDGQAMPRLPFVPVHHQNPPSAGRYTTYGEWPNSKSRLQPPASLVGNHDVKGNYSPDIHFNLPPGKDYMPPLTLNAQEKTPAGATKLVWQPVTNATGYFATMFGASPNGGDDVSMVMWSSSGISTFAGGGLLDYLAPAEVRRLIGQKVVMPPTQTQCVVPVEVTNAAKFGMLSMIAYGDEANFVDPPRPADPKIPWNINWTTKVRYKSTTGLMLGMPGMGGGMGAAGDDDDRPAAGSSSTPPPPPPKKKKGGLFGTLQDLGAIPH